MCIGVCIVCCLVCRFVRLRIWVRARSLSLGSGAVYGLVCWFCQGLHVLGANVGLAEVSWSGAVLGL